MGNLESIVPSIDTSGSSEKENNGSLNGERPDREVGFSIGKRLPEGTTEESNCVKRRKRGRGILNDPILLSEHGFFICQRCGNEEDFGGLKAIKCTSCRSIIWFPPRRPSYKVLKEDGVTRINRVGNVYPDGYVEELGKLQKRLHKGSGTLSFPYGEDDLMDFEITVIPKIGLYKGAKVVFSIDVHPLYPKASPMVRCKTKIYHPLIDLEGNVGISFLGNRWSSSLHRIADVVELLKYILVMENEVVWGNVVTLNHEADAMWKGKSRLFARKVREALGGGFIGDTYFPRCLVD